jgi:tripartite-type tricarboxylate transporter receptor subunit TctC
MKTSWIAVAFAMAVAAATGANAETYPSRPITVIVPFPAGGPTDTLARIVGEKMKDTLGQPMIVENVSGAGSTIGSTRAIGAKPDGYTLIVGNWTSHVGANVLYPVSWHIVNDLTPVVRLPTSVLMILAKKDFPANDVKGLIDYLKANPDKVSAASVGAGSGAHVCGLYFADKTGTKFQFVPYRGGAPAMQDLIAGHVELFCGEASQALSAVRAGQVKALVAMSEERWGPLPNVSTLKEIGLDTTIPFWHGMWAPKGTPKDVVDRLNAAAVAAFKDPTVQKRVADLGQTIPTAAQLTPQALGAWHQAEIDKWWPFIKAANIKAQ